VRLASHLNRHEVASPAAQGRRWVETKKAQTNEQRQLQVQTRVVRALNHQLKYPKCIANVDVFDDGHSPVTYRAQYFTELR
jgi:hypothetical protein